MRMNLNIGASLGDVPAELVNFLRMVVNRTKRSVDGHLGFGDGTDVDNMYGKWKSYTTNAIANTEDTVAHSLKMIPVGYLVFSIDKAGVLYKGATAWDTTNIYLKCSVASAAVLIFILPPSSKDV